MLSCVCQLYPRLPQPLTQSGSGFAVAGPNVPTLGFRKGPHSPLSAGFFRSQSGKKFLFESVQLRAVEKFAAGPNSDATDVVSVVTYRLMPPLMTVLPLPVTSHATPTRGLRSFQLGTLSTPGAVKDGKSALAGSTIVGSCAVIQSKRSPAFTVTRPSDH